MTNRSTALKTFGIRLPWGLGFSATVGLVMASLASCGGPKSGQPGPVTEHPPCDTDVDCVEPGEVCSAHKVCLPRSVGALSFALELRPPEDPAALGGLKLAQHELAPLDLDFSGGGAVVTLPEAVRLTGSVMVVGDVPVPIQATVTAARRSGIPGRPKVLVSRTVLAEGFLLRPSPEDVDPAFDVLVTRDATHTLRAAPSSPYDESYHPIVRDVRLEADESQWFMFGDPEASIHVAGAVVDALGHGVAGVRVKAVDEDAGQYISSTGISDETGAFHLLLPRGVRSYALSFGPSAGNAELPEVAHEGVLIGLRAQEQGADNSYDNPEVLGEFQLPAYPTPQRFLFSLVGRSGSGEEVVIPDAHVTFTTQIGYEATLVGTYTVTALSDADGRVSVDLVPGATGQNRSYEVTIIPPADSEFAADVLAGERAVVVGAMGGAGPRLELARRAAYTGLVQSAGLNPVVDVTVQARRLDGPVALLGSLRTTTSKEDGRFSLKLDPGLYAIELLPPAGLPLPRWKLPEEPLVLEGGTQLIYTDAIVLPSAEVLEVQVLAGTGTHPALAGVAVAVYLVDDFCAALNPADYALCDREPMLLGEGLTDASGRARVLVPGP